MTLLGLESMLRRRPGTLSGGERQRVALGRALMAQPALLLMDEPLAALDVPRKAQVIDYIERLRDEIGVPIVFVSHAVDEVARLAGTIVVMAGGKVAAAGPAAEVMARLDLDPLAGIEAAGAVLDATVQHHDSGLWAHRTRGAGRHPPRAAPQACAGDTASGFASGRGTCRWRRPSRAKRASSTSSAGGVVEIGPQAWRLGRRGSRHRRPAHGAYHGTLRRYAGPHPRQPSLRAGQERRGRSGLAGPGRNRMMT